MAWQLDFANLPSPTKLIVGLLQRIRDRIHTWEDQPLVQGDRLTGAGTAGLGDVTAALVAGARYDVTFNDTLGPVPNAGAGPMFCQLSTAAAFGAAGAPAVATLAGGLQLQHGDSRYIRVPSTGGPHYLFALFPHAAAYATVTQSDERSEIDS